MENVPNTRVVEGDNVTYMCAGGALKVRYELTRSEKGWMEFDPSKLKVWFNGAPIELLQELTIEIKDGGLPTATMRFTLDELDVDLDSLVALHAIVRRSRVRRFLRRRRSTNA